MFQQEWISTVDNSLASLSRAIRQGQVLGKKNCRSDKKNEKKKKKDDELVVGMTDGRGGKLR